MASNVFGGREATLLIGTSGATSSESTAVGRLRNWEFAANRDQIDVTSNDSSGWREMIPGIGSWQISAEALALATGAALSQDNLRDFLSSETLLKAFLFTSTASGGVVLSGNCYVSNWTWSGAHDDTQLHNFELQGDGSYTES